MTLIVGVILPKGVLLVSDTRETDLNSGSIIEEYKRKILSITPTTFLASAGSESSWLTSRILRNCLYNSTYDYPTLIIRKKILKLYQQINELHRTSMKNKHPVGEILIAEYSKESKVFNLLQQSGLVGFNRFNVKNKIKDFEIIGSDNATRNSVRVDVQRLLDSLTLNELAKEDVLFTFVAREIHKLIRMQKAPGVGKHVYCTYLSLLKGFPASSVFFIKEDGKLIPMDQQDDSDVIKLS